LVADISPFGRGAAEDDAARVVLDDAADATRRPEVAVYDIVDAVRAAVAGIVAVPVVARKNVVCDGS